MSSAKINISNVLHSSNAEYIAHLYGQYLENKTNVDESWQNFFNDLNDDEADLLAELSGASWTPSENRKSSNSFKKARPETYMPSEAMTQPLAAANQAEGGAARRKGDTASSDVIEATQDSVSALMLIRAYRARGHLIADLDPLGLREKEEHPELHPSYYGFSPSDYDRPIYLNNVLGLEYGTLRQIMDVLKETYCGKIGIEFMHLTDPEEKAWIQKRIEGIKNHTEFTVNGRKAMLSRLNAAEAFETFLHVKYPGTKRFGLDGGESLIPGIEQIMKRGGQLGLNEIVIGMAHRGRLNVLTNVMGKPFRAVFAEFQGTSSHPDDVQGSGDVKYHLGTSGDRDFDGNEIHLSLTANPSHLEAVNPVVIGKVRAKQIQKEDTDATQVMPLLLHGDAAFAGQGIVAETLMISELPGYRVGGSIHMVINNQIGFTTTPMYGRSGPYCTDVAKMLSAPIFHVNGDDPEAVVHVSRIAIEFRQKFKKDVVIDMFCYRRHGHNEGDEPMFTQPKMYKKISEHPTTKDIYAKKLVDDKILLQDEVDEIIGNFKKELEEAFESASSYKMDKADYLEGAWQGFKVAEGGPRRGTTAIDEKLFKEVGEKLTKVPDDFDLNSKIKRLLKTKKKMFAGDQPFDWATGEALAFGSLLREGYPVRLSGQDCGRGTFSQRHATLYDQTTNEKYFPLSNLSEDQSRFEVHDSPLSEAAVLGFEYGYTLADPRSLVLWEAQFGDFVNSAQVHIDQFISSGELKWLRMSGLVMLLPHGYEGQGPEHSSARMERFLQQSAEDNWQICNCTTPAQYFHVLRRQIHRDFRKPLIMMTPKSLLRHKGAVSQKHEFLKGSSFHRFLWDDGKDKLAANKKIKRVVMCSGKVYFDLLKERDEREIDDVYLMRLEQLYPFPDVDLGEELSQFPNAEIIWCQEEPKNMGSWQFINERLEETLVNSKHKCKRPKYVGRPEAASPATGIASRHVAEQAALVDEALKL